MIYHLIKQLALFLSERVTPLKRLQSIYVTFVIKADKVYMTDEFVCISDCLTESYSRFVSLGVRKWFIYNTIDRSVRPILY